MTVLENNLFIRTQIVKRRKLNSEKGEDQTRSWKDIIDPSLAPIGNVKQVLKEMAEED